MTSALVAAAEAAAAVAAVPVAALAPETPVPIVFATAVLDIAAEPSALRLRSFAERCRHEEGVARCPFVLLQALALARQFQCLHPPPEAQHERKRYAQSLKAHGECASDSAQATASLQGSRGMGALLLAHHMPP